jgi:hypothetical protein
VPETLTIEQAAERQAMICDGNFMDDTIAKVSEYDPGRFTVSQEGGLTFGAFLVPGGMEPPKVGDTYRLYGTTGLGGRVVGGDLRGEPCWFQTQAEVDAEHAEWMEQQTAKKVAEYAQNKDDLQAQYEALDPDLKFRIDRFVENCPEDWWVEFGGYEMFALQMADAIATKAKESDDPQGAVEFFRALPYGDQHEILADLVDIGASSGNQFGYSCLVAHFLTMSPGEDRAGLLRWGHGAMVPLVGCEGYGCRQPTDEELAALKAEFSTEEAEEVVPEVVEKDPRWEALGNLATYVRENTRIVAPDEEVRGAEVVINTHFLHLVPDPEAKREDFVRVMEAVMEHGGEFNEMDAERFSQGPSYIEIGAWCGDQTLALQIMALGARLGVWDVITPATLGIEGSDADDLAGRGFVMVSGYYPQGKPTPTEATEEG